MLRYWLTRYLKEGVKGLRARGGQGRKRDVSKEDVARAVLDSIESGGEKGNGGGEKPSCRACIAEDAEGGGGGGGPRRRRPPPKKCKCKGRCVNPGRCACREGRMCKCKCCRPLKHPPKGPAPRPRLLAPPEGRAEGSDAGRRRAQPHTRQARQDVQHGHMYALMKTEGGVTYHKVSKSAANHASVPAVRSWEWRQEERLEQYRKKGTS